MNKINNKGFAISTLIYGVFILFVMILFILISLMNSSLRLLDDKVNNENNYEVNEGGEGIKPNPPELFMGSEEGTVGLVPVKYNGTNWVTTTEGDEDWYNYDEQKWANAVILDLTTDEKKYRLLNADDSYKTGVELTLPYETSTESDVLAMFVWIPRFSYTIKCNDINSDGKYDYYLKVNVDGYNHKNYNECLGAERPDDDSEINSVTPGVIDIQFDPVTKIRMPEIIDVGGTKKYSYPVYVDSEPKNWYTHPAFWWDKDSDGNRDKGEELSGIWVGKFETSANPGTCYNNLNGADGGYFNKDSTIVNCSSDKINPRIVPNVPSLIYQDMFNQFKTSLKFKDELSNVDSHMMKNSEWASVMYLAQSKYGKYGNSYYSGVDRELYRNNTGSDNVSPNGGYGSRNIPSITGCRILSNLGKELSYELSSGNIDKKYISPIIKYDDKIFFKENIIDNVNFTDDEIDKIKNQGTGASTTGNIYGIYDVFGGSSENVMAVLLSDGASKYNWSDAGFDSYELKLKYYDELYKSSQDNPLETIGHALDEIYFRGDNELPAMRAGSLLERGAPSELRNQNADDVFDMIGGSSLSSAFRVVLVNES